VKRQVTVRPWTTLQGGLRRSATIILPGNDPYKRHQPNPFDIRITVHHYAS